MKIIKKLLFIIISGLTAIILLNFLLLFYYMIPLHMENPDKSTDYIWEPNSNWFKMTEGISWGKMDALGFNNLSVIENPEVIMLGSSHMEGTHILQKYNTVNQLQLFLEEGNCPLRVYNKGISGTDFLKCCKYLNSNTQISTAKYIVIEAWKIEWNSSDIEKLFNNKIEYIESHAVGIIYYLQKLPLFRLLYFQLEHGLIGLFTGTTNSNTMEFESNLNKYNEPQNQIQDNYEKLFSYIANNSNGKKIVIFYHPIGRPTETGELSYQTSTQYIIEFARAAEKHGIGFIDLTEETENLWHTEHKTAHGFTTGTAFGGHMNRNGHKIAARKLADYIIQNEEKTDVAF